MNLSNIGAASWSLSFSWNTFYWSSQLNGFLLIFFCQFVRKHRRRFFFFLFFFLLFFRSRCVQVPASISKVWQQKMNRGCQRGFFFCLLLLCAAVVPLSAAGRRPTSSSFERSDSQPTCNFSAVHLVTIWLPTRV